MGSENVSRETSSASGSVSVTKSDTTVYDPPSRGVYVGTAGDLKVRMAGDRSEPTYTNLPIGFHPLCVDMVYSTGTAADGIILLR
jgi:hypothetical protein